MKISFVLAFDLYIMNIVLKTLNKFTIKYFKEFHKFLGF